MSRRSSFRDVCVQVMVALIYVSGQAQPRAEYEATLSFIDNAGNVLQNDLALGHFFKQLYQLKRTDSGTVNVIHIGDSHIQADLLTEVVRKGLQSEFGNAGRGLVVPGRVAGTNEPFNIRTSASGTWTSKRIVHPAKPLPIGVGAITVSTEAEDGSLAVSMRDVEIDYRFNRLTLFLANGTRSYSIAVTDSLSVELARYVPPNAPERMDAVKLILPGLYRHVELRNVRESEGQSHTTLFGLSFENGRPGVLYHAIGVNGARYDHFNTAEMFAQQTSLLGPSLIVISLGTNEAVEYPNLKRDFVHQIDLLVNNLKISNPDATFLLITPPAAFLRKVKPNPGVEIIRQKILEYAVENGIAFWDMHKVAGGVSSATQWKESGLLRQDGIHFSRDGYALQGKLLFEAIMKSYDRYVAGRYP